MILWKNMSKETNYPNQETERKNIDLGTIKKIYRKLKENYL